MAKKAKFYAVWKGRKTGVFYSWDDCKSQVEGFEGAQYKSYDSESNAVNALQKSFFSQVSPPKTNESKLFKSKKPIGPALVVDAAWNTKTLDMEYQGIDLQTGKKLFHQGPFRDGTNNIGEYLAIVHALALLHKNNLDLPIYSDSITAISWIKKKKANTKLEETQHNAPLFEMLDRAQKWLNTHRYMNPILKWETEDWGENPADFGRK
jgi:ribonuclease HI